MVICTFSARTHASEACMEDLMIQARKIKYDVIGLTETRRHRPLHAVFETGEELFLGICDSRGVGGVGVLVNTHLAMNIDSYESLTTRTARLRLRRCGSTPALTIFVAYAPTSSYEEEELEAFYMDLERLYRGNHTPSSWSSSVILTPRFSLEERLKSFTSGLTEWNEQGERLVEFIMSTHTIHGNSRFQKQSHLRWTWESPGGQFHDEIDHIIFNRRFCLTDDAVVSKFYTGSDHHLLRARFCFSMRGERAMKFRKRSLKTSINWDHFASIASEWEDSVSHNIDEEYNRLVEHLYDSARKAESPQLAKRRLSSKTLELIRQRGSARATGNHQQTSELAKLCREAIKEGLKDRRAAIMDEAAEAGESIRKARRSLANYKTKMTSLRRPDGAVTASRRAMEKVIYDFYSNLFDSHVFLPTHHLRQDEDIAPSVPSSEIRHAITSMKNCTAPGPDRIKPEHLKSLPPVIVRTVARLFTRYLSKCKVHSWKTRKTVLLYKKGDPDDVGNYRPVCLLSVIYKLFTRGILNRIGRILDEGQPCEQAGFRRGFSTIEHIHTLTRLIEVSREYKMPLCLTFTDLKKACDTVETEAVIKALGNHDVTTQ
nr:Endonuclease exonuclease phosphatase and RNA-directed DNA polymerase (reverse transcriptase) domain containing protein [Haemonchus contortus]